MSKFDVIEKALLLNNVCEDDVIKTDTSTIFSLHLLSLLVLLLYNFAIQTKMSEEELFDFIMQNFIAILDIAITEIEITLLHFCNIYDEELAEEIELHYKDECLISLAIQNKVDNKLKKLMEE